MRETRIPRCKRAVTPFFRVFGTHEILSGEAMLRAEGEGQHRGEWCFLSVLIPLVAGAAVFDLLWRAGGPWLAWLGVLPGLFLILTGAVFLVGGKTPAARWRRWALLLAGWSLWQILGPGGGVAWAAWLWLGFLLLNGLALLYPAWFKLMTSPVFCTTGWRWGIWVLAHVPALVLGLFAGWQWAAVFFFAIGAVWACGTFLPNARIFGPLASRVEGDEVLLTFDDGPDPERTPAILDLLDAHGRKAVFFVIGEKVRRHPELAREIVRRGHELGNHTLTHPAGSFWGAGSVRTRREITGCSRAIEEITGMPPRWFRAPVGHRNWFTHPVCRELGLEIVAWNRRAFDTVRSDVDGIVRCLVKDLARGDILLLHDTTPVAVEVAARVLAALDEGRPGTATRESPPRPS